MKKQIFLLAALAMTFAACQNERYDVEDKTVATFEEAAISPKTTESVYHLSETGEFVSGNFIFEQEVSTSDWGTYYFGNVVTNQTGKTYDNDYNNDKSCVGGAYEGNNFCVWTASYAGEDGVELKQAAKVPGFYVCNTPWVVSAILNGDGMSNDGGKPFGENDYFLLTITGELDDVKTGTVEFYLAKGTEYVKDWTYVNLSSLGKVDELHFALSGSKVNDYGLTTPAYFAFDNLGAK